MSVTSPQKKESQGVKSGEQGAREWVLLFISNDHETPCPERHQHCGRSEVVHHLNGKLFVQGHDME
jgi:hypothetical protein